MLGIVSSRVTEHQTLATTVGGGLGCWNSIAKEITNRSKQCLIEPEQAYNLHSKGCVINTSNLPTLANRRKYLGLCYLYNNVFEFPDCPLTRRVLNYPNRNGRADLFLQPRANSDIFHYSFFPSTISL